LFDVQSGNGEVAYVSVTPGSFPEADSARLRNLATEFSRTDPMVDGGLDPVPVPAAVGDTIEISILQGGTVVEQLFRAVPLRSVIVPIRSDPGRGRTSVPLNASVMVVFSEPLNANTVTPATVQLLQGSVQVPAELTVTDDALRLLLVPESLLANSTTYTIVVTTGVSDLAGDPVQSEFRSDFTTRAAQLADQIAFENRASPSGRFEIFVMNADGSEIVQLTNAVAGGFSLAPAVSPDGRKIAFSVFVDLPGALFQDFEIYVMNADGSNPVNLTNDPGFDGWRPAWSPDGSKIAFFSGRDDDEIYVMNADGTDRRRITNSPGSDANPAWSPDGTKIAFVSLRDGFPNDEIYVMNADGTGQTNLTNHPASDDWPAWSPDGTKIAFASDRDGSFGIWVMNADGTNPTKLVAGRSSPAWSPDGTRLAFDSGGRIDVVNADGTGLTRLAAGFFPSWSP
jgi:TolB protein